MQLTEEQIAALAEIERWMDDSKIPFVMLEGMRVAVMQTVMDRLKLSNGQTISNVIFGAIERINLELIQDEIAKRSVSDWMSREGFKEA